MNLKIVGDTHGIISVTDSIGEASFCEVTTEDKKYIINAINEERKGRKVDIWSDNDYEEPNQICYVYWDEDKFLEIHHTDTLLNAVLLNMQLYKITVEYYI